MYGRAKQTAEDENEITGGEAIIQGKISDKERSPPVGEGGLEPIRIRNESLVVYAVLYFPKSIIVGPVDHFQR